MENTPLFEKTFRLSVEDYLAFSLDAAEDTTVKSGKKLRIWGIVEIALAIVMFVTSLTLRQDNMGMFLFLNVLLLVLGLFSLLYFPFLFPRQMRKAAEKSYARSEYLNHDISIAVHEDYFEETGYLNGGAVTNQVMWEDIPEIRQTPSNYFIMMDGSRGVVVPKSIFNDPERIQFEKFIETKKKSGYVPA